MITIHFAIKHNMGPDVERLVREGGRDLINSRDSFQQTGLHIASYEGFSDIVHFLLENGALLNERDNHGWTPLHCAANQGHLDICEQLLEAGAEVNFLTETKTSVLHYLVRLEHISKRILDILLERQVDVNSQNENGETPLHQAAFREREVAIRWLIQNKADVHLKNKQRETALHFAARRGSRKAIQILLSAGADLNAVGDLGSCAEVAIISNHYHLLEVFRNSSPPSVMNVVIEVDPSTFEGQQSDRAKTKKTHLRLAFVFFILLFILSSFLFLFLFFSRTQDL